MAVTPSASEPAPAIVAFMDPRAQDQTSSDRLARDLHSSGPMTAWWLGRTHYRDAWDLQHRVVTARAAGLIDDQLLLLEHEPVLTLGRHSDPAHVLASTDELAERGVELIRVERGGEIGEPAPHRVFGWKRQIRDRRQIGEAQVLSHPG